MRRSPLYLEFNEREATELIGQTIETIAPFRRLPIRTRGRIVGSGLEVPKFHTAHGWWRIVVEWETQSKGFPLRDWVAKWELEKYCQIVSD